MTGMHDIAFICLEGVLADQEQRYTQAVEWADQQWGEAQRGSQYYETCKWERFFQPALIDQDTPTDSDNAGWLSLLSGLDYQIIYLSSRPEYCREQTVAWLKKYGLYEHDRLLFLKPEAFKYTKSAVWIAGTIAQCSYALNAREVLFICTEQAWVEKVQQYPYSFKVQCYTNLDLQRQTQHDETTTAGMTDDDEETNPF